MGIETIMLTGDNQITARTVAADLGIDDIQADLKPEDKTAAIDRLKEKYGAVVMIGDGINDVRYSLGPPLVSQWGRSEPMQRLKRLTLR